VLQQRVNDSKEIIYLRTVKIFVMKKYFEIELSKTELAAFVLIVSWIVAAAFVPLPAVCSLGM
jgi:hypothetical protein